MSESCPCARRMLRSSKLPYPPLRIRGADQKIGAPHFNLPVSYVYALTAVSSDIPAYLRGARLHKLNSIIEELARTARYKYRTQKLTSDVFGPSTPLVSDSTPQVSVMTML